jgi:hypothetical protein
MGGAAARPQLSFYLLRWVEPFLRGRRAFRMAQHFSRPPNWFDHYVSYELWRTRAQLDEAKAAERNALIYSWNHMLVEVQSVRAEAQAREWILQRTIAERGEGTCRMREGGRHVA